MPIFTKRNFWIVQGLGFLPLFLFAAIVKLNILPDFFGIDTTDEALVLPALIVLYLLPLLAVVFTLPFILKQKRRGEPIKLHLALGIVEGLWVTSITLLIISLQYDILRVH